MWKRERADTLFNFEGPDSRKGDKNLLKEKMVEQDGKPTEGSGGVAQLGEHLPCKQGVDSSILFISTRGWAHSSGG